MKSVILPRIPENKYDQIMEFLKRLDVPVIENSHADYKFTEEEKTFMDDRLKYYLENPKNVKDFDQALDDIENGL